MFVILWCFCAQARCKLFLRLGRGGSDSCTADDQPLPPRTIVRDELKESRQTLVDLQQKLADGSNKRGQEMPGQNDCFVLILFCFVLFHLITPAFSSFDSVKNLCNDTVSHVVRCNIQGSSTYGPSGVNSKRRGIQRYL